MSVSFDGQVVVITGAGGALGRSHALAFAARGARVVVNDPGTSARGDGSSGTVAQSVVESIRATGGTAVANLDSVADPQGARRVIEQALDTYGRVDVLVNNAGAMRDKSFRKMDLEDYRAVVDVNLHGTAYVTHSAFPVMLEQGYGRIVMTTSGSGLYGVFGAANYCAGKMGVVGLMHGLRLEGERHDVRVNAIAPIAGSRLTTGFIDDRRLARMSPGQVTPLVLWLASRRCGLSGEIFAAGAGYFARIAIVEGGGVRFPPGADITPEAIEQRLDEIRDLSAARTFGSILEAVDALAGG